MGYTAQEFTSANLTRLYPSLYREFQVINWSHVDVVITEANGEQTTRPRDLTPVRESEACVILETISCNGLRVQKDSTLPAHDAKALQMKGKRISVPFESFLNAPVRVEELGCIISTVEQAAIAKNMMCEINYGALIYENRTDVELTDPRFVFQIIDPNNQWDALLVNVFGQTVILRAGHYGKIIRPTMQQQKTPEAARLIWYLRYPTEYFGSAKEKNIVFNIPLDEIYKKEPYLLPGGDYVCIATDMDSLQEVLAKKSSCAQGICAAVNLSDKMIPKEVYETAEANFKSECERLKQEAKQRLETLLVQKNNELAKLQAKLDQVTHEKEKAEARAREWEAVNDVRTHVEENRHKESVAAEKVRKEMHDDARADIDHMWTALKIGGTIVTGVFSFAVTLMTQAAKKK